jgi:ubiquinone/menaquinone biosynthesis C-methylase UbiE
VTVSPRDHYSYALYADPDVARTFDDRRFSGPIGELLAAAQETILRALMRDLRAEASDAPAIHVLDVGTGTGRAALILAKEGAQVTGVDASEQMLAVARRRAEQQGVEMDLVRGDAHALDFPDRAFHAVVSLRVLMHAPRWRTCVGELCRVADRLVVIDFPSRSSAAAIQSAGRRIAQAAGIRTEAYRVFSSRDITDALAEHGFQVRSLHRQFVLPIALHKAVGSRSATVAVEALLARAGLHDRFGSPVTVVAERCASS